MITRILTKLRRLASERKRMKLLCLDSQKVGGSALRASSLFYQLCSSTLYGYIISSSFVTPRESSFPKINRTSVGGSYGEDDVHKPLFMDNGTKTLNLIITPFENPRLAELSFVD